MLKGMEFFLPRLYNFLKSDPKRNSADSNELCRRVIEKFLKEQGCKIYTPYEVSGYFLEAKFDERYAIDEFKKGISELLDRLIYLARRKAQEEYKVYFNSTGGLKAHVIVTALARFLTNYEIII